MANATPEQREMGNKILGVDHRGSIYRWARDCAWESCCLSLVLWGTINFGFGGKAKFGEIFAVSYYAWLPEIFKALLGTIVIYSGMAPESFNIKNFAPTNLGAFLDPVETNKALYSLATSLDAFTIWTSGAAGHGHCHRCRNEAQFGLHRGVWLVGADAADRCGLDGDDGVADSFSAPAWLCDWHAIPRPQVRGTGAHRIESDA